MSFENWEFPHTNFYGSDLRELIRMYKQLSEDYSTIKSEIDKAVDFIDNFRDYVGDTVSEIVNDKLLIVNNRLDALTEAIKRIDLNIDEIETNITELYSDIDMLRNHFNEEILAIRLEIATMYQVFADYKHSIDDIIADKILEMIGYIEEHVQQIERLYVTNPMTGEFVNIQDVLNMFAEYIALGYGLTAEEYDSLKLTTLAYDSMRLTALAYSMRGYLIFFKKLKMTMISPFTGEMDSYENVIYTLTNLHRKALTAQIYDEQLFTSDVYDGFAISAYNYDWHGEVLAVQPITQGGI